MTKAGLWVDYPLAHPGVYVIELLIDSDRGRAVHAVAVDSHQCIVACSVSGSLSALSPDLKKIKCPYKVISTNKVYQVMSRVRTREKLRPQDPVPPDRAVEAASILQAGRRGMKRPLVDIS